ncbi:MAG: hypothetical protein Q3985_02025 [Eubacteriales bacterium]|nr:hypothetical protein [Eubacteriales bacterium]
MKAKWNALSMPQKIVTIASLCIGVLVILFSVLQICGIWDKAICVFEPLLATVFLCQAYLQWQSSRKIAYGYIGVAIFIFICSVVILLSYLK